MTAILRNDGEIAARSLENDSSFFKGMELGSEYMIGQSKNNLSFLRNVLVLHTWQRGKILIIQAFFAFAKIF